MRMTERQGRVGAPPSAAPQTPPLLNSTLALFSRYLQDGENCSLENWEAEGRVVQVPPHSPPVTLLDYLCVVARLWPPGGLFSSPAFLLPLPRLSHRKLLFPLEKWTCGGEGRAEFSGMSRSRGGHGRSDFLPTETPPTLGSSPEFLPHRLWVKGVLS